MHRRGHQHLFRRCGRRGQRSPARGVQFGEDVVEQQHRVASFRTQQFVGRQPQCQRQRPRFPVAGKAFRGLVAEPQFQFVAVWADQTHPTFQFGARGARPVPSSIAASQHVAIRGPAAGRRPPVGWRGSRSTRGRDAGCQQLVGLLDFGRQLVHQVDAGGHQLSTVLGQPPVPDVEGVQRAVVAAESGARQRISTARCVGAGLCRSRRARRPPAGDAPSAKSSR